MRYSVVPENLENLKVALYNPHPGVGGAGMPLPADIKQAIDEMAKIQVWGGVKLLRLKEAFNRLQSTVGDRGKVTLHLLPEETHKSKKFQRGYFSLEIVEEKNAPPEDIVIKNIRLTAIPDEDGKYRNKYCWCLIWFVEDIKS